MRARRRFAECTLLGGLTLGVLGCAAPRSVNRIAYFPPPPSAPRAVRIAVFNGLGDLVTPHASFLERVRGGSIRPQVGTPAGIAYADGHLYVCDTAQNVVHDWNLGTGDARRIGDSGDVTLTKPVDVAVGSDGTVYVADSERGAVYAFDSSGRTVARFRQSRDGNYRPVSVAVHGDHLYVADIAAHVVDVFSTTEAKHITSIGKIGSEPGTFYFPMGVAHAADGKLAVADMMNARVQIFDASHAPVAAFGQPGNRYGDLGQPKHLDVGPDGVVFIADPEFGRIHLFDDRGRLLMLLGESDDPSAGAPMPMGVAVAHSLPPNVANRVPAGFNADYFVFTTDTVARRRISLFAIGKPN